MPTRVSYDNAATKLKALANVLQRPLQDVLDSGARVMATQMARTAQPFGTGADALQAGRSAVARDIYKVYATPSQAYADITHPKAKAVFWKAMIAGEYEVAQRVLQDFGSNLSGCQVARFDGGTAHKAARNRGRVRSTRPVHVVTDPQRLTRYIEHVQDNVGFGKGGFADIARALGKSPRGLREDGDITANWILKHTGFGKAFHGGTDENPTVRIVNAVPYASDILNGTARSEAIRIGRERMIENLQIAVREEAKKLRSAA
jgi:hypothetical protein